MEPSLEQRIRDVFGPRSDVQAVYLFGSTARGTAGSGSDVDVGVLFDSPHANDDLGRAPSVCSVYRASMSATPSA